MTAKRTGFLRDRIIDEIKYRIATGAWKAGARLPPLRSMARDFRVHFHTVRRACLQLQGEGALKIRHGSGIYVDQGAPDPAARGELGRVMASAFRRAVGLGFSTGDILRAASREARRLGGRRPRRTIFVECSLEQAREHAREISVATRLSVSPVLLARLEDRAPAARIITTYFHFHDLRRRFPGTEILPVTVRPHPSLLSHLAGTWRRTQVALLCRDRASVRTLRAQVQAVVHGSVRVRGYCLADLADLRRVLRRYDAVVYMPPCRSQALALRRSGIQVIELAYRIDPRSLARLMKTLGEMHGEVGHGFPKSRGHRVDGSGDPRRRPAGGRAERRAASR